MDQNNVKKRDVMSFESFAKAYEEAKKVVPMKKGENPHPGAHAIEAEGLFYRHDANPYVAAGIPIGKPEDANFSDTRTAAQVDVYPQPHDGQDPLKGAKVVKGQDVNANITEEEKKAAAEATKIVTTMSGITATDAGTVSESTEK